MSKARLINVSAHDMQGVEDDSVHLALGSPPFWSPKKGQRKYEGEVTIDWPEVVYKNPFDGRDIVIPAVTCVLGEEETWQGYIGHMMLCTREQGRVLRYDGVLVFDIGDKYVNKSQMLLAEKLAMVAGMEGWYVRNVIPWVKLQGMCGPPHGKFHLSHHSLVVMTKGSRYYWNSDAIRRPPAGYKRKGGTAEYNGGGSATHGKGSKTLHQMSEDGRNIRTSDIWLDSVGQVAEWLGEYSDYLRHISSGGEGALVNERDEFLGIVCATQQGGGRHYAAWPEKLAEMFIRAGTSGVGVCPGCGEQWAKNEKGYGLHFCPCVPEHFPGSSVRYDRHMAARVAPIPATVLDMFAGTGVTGKVAVRLGRDVVLTDVSKEYLIEIATGKIDKVQMEMFYE